MCQSKQFDVGWISKAHPTPKLGITYKGSNTQTDNKNSAGGQKQRRMRYAYADLPTRRPRQLNVGWISKAHPTLEPKRNNHS